MEAIILVGGLGTRLGALTAEMPKPMLPIRGVPFLKLLLRYLKRNGFERVVLAVGYKKEVVEEYFTTLLSEELPIIVYAIEKMALGTGGAILNALPYVNTDDIFIVNGDSYLELSFRDMLNFHKDMGSDLTVASYYMEDVGRYGVLRTGNNCEIISFSEKGTDRKGLINGGVYLFNREKLGSVFRSLIKTTFSFEEEVLSKQTNTLRMTHFQTEGCFLDIGVSADYERAQTELFCE